MWGFETTVQKILSGAVIYIILISSMIFVHWMWFSDADLVIGRRSKRALKPGESVMIRGWALPSSYYEKIRVKEEEEKKNALKTEVSVIN